MISCSLYFLQRINVALKTLILKLAYVVLIFSSHTGKPVDLVFAIGSDSAINYEKMKNIVQNITDAYDIGPTMTRVGMVEYSGNAEVLVFLKFNFSKGQFKTYINRLRLRSGGNLTGALRMVYHLPVSPP